MSSPSRPRTRPQPVRIAAVFTVAVLVATALLIDARPAAAQPSPTVLGDFETGTAPWTVVTGGTATGSLSRTTESPATGSGAGRLAVNAPSGLVEMARSVAAVEAREVRLSVRSAELRALVLRLRDTTGQVHQQVLTLSPGDGWQDLSVTEFAGGTGYLHWGGADDGQWHGPLTQISLLVDYFRIDPGPTATVDVDDVAALVAEPSLEIVPTRLGNAFATGAAASVGFRADAETLDWTVRDARGAVVGQGSEAVADLGGRVDFGALPTGWYAVELVATRSDGSVVSGGTDLSVLPAGAARDRRLGASVHYGQSWDPATIPLIANAGFGFARDEAYWAAQETVKGTIDFTDKVETYADALEANDLDFLDIWAYGNPLYHQGEAPATDEGRAGYAAYALASADRFGTDDTVFEVWNEWNWRDLSGPAGGTAENYVKLLQAATAKVRPAHPDAVIVGPALAPMEDWQGWVDRFIAAGGLDEIDAFSTHPYNFTGEPEQFLNHVAVLRAKFAAAGHPDLPIWLTEHGWHTSTTSVGVTEPRQARNLARAQLLALGEGLGRYTSYDFKDDGVDPAEPEDRFGIIRNENDPRGGYTPKPAYVTQGVLTRTIADRGVEERLSLGAGNYGIVFGGRPGEPSGSGVHALWATAGQTWSVAADGPVTVTDLYGARSELQPDGDGRVHVSVGPDPIYLTGVLGAVTTSSPYALAAGDGVAGEPVPGTWTVPAAPAGLELDVAGELTEAGGGGEVAVRLPASPVPGPRTWTALVRQDGRPIGWLTAGGQVRPALALTGSHALDPAGQDLLRFRLANATSSPITVDRLTWSVGAATGSGPAGAVVPAGGELVHDVPVALTGSTTWSAAASGSTAARSDGVLAPADPVPVPYGTPDIDGALDDDVAALPPQTLGEEEQAVPDWGGADDLSGRLWLTHDDEALYLSAVITDDTQAQPARAGDTWQGDGVQLGFAPTWPGEDVRRVDELGAALTDAGPVDVFRWLPAGTDLSGVVAEVARDDEARTTTYEARIPWAAIGVEPDDGLLSGTIAFNENDGAGRRGWTSWGQGVAESKDPAKFNALRLLPARAGTEVALRVTVRAQCRPSGAAVAVHAVNLEKIPVDLRLITPFGERKFSAVAPGRAVDAVFEAEEPSLAADTVVAAGYLRRDGIPSYQRHEASYPALTCRG